MGLWRCRAARRRTGLGARRNPPRAPADVGSRVLSRSVVVPALRSYAPGESRPRAFWSAGGLQAVLRFAKEMRGDPPAALQHRFDFFRAAAEFGDAFAPVVGGLDVAVEGLLAGGGDGRKAVDLQPVGRDLPVGGADPPHLGDVLVVGDADREPPSQAVHRADEAAELALAEVAGGDMPAGALAPRGPPSIVSTLLVPLGTRIVETIAVFRAGEGG